MTLSLTRGAPALGPDWHATLIAAHTTSYPTPERGRRVTLYFTLQFGRSAASDVTPDPAQPNPDAFTAELCGPASPGYAALIRAPHLQLCAADLPMITHALRALDPADPLAALARTTERSRELLRSDPLLRAARRTPAETADLFTRRLAERFPGALIRAQQRLLDAGGGAHFTPAHEALTQLLTLEALLWGRAEPSEHLHLPALPQRAAL